MPETLTATANTSANVLDADAQRSPRPFWSGTISFGLVSIPVDLYPANQSSHVGLRMLAPDGTPLQRRYFSSKNGRELTDEEIVRGYEITDDQFVVVSDEELESLAPEKSRDIDLRLFVSQEAVPPLYFERGYFLAPSGDSSKAYQLLAAVMEKTKRAGLATFVMRGKEYLIAILAENGILHAETMRFKNELRTPADIGLPADIKTDSHQVIRFEDYIGKNSEPKLSTRELHDETSEQLLSIVRKKETHKENIVETSEAEQGGGAEVINILDVLKKSLTPAAQPESRPQAKRASRSRATRSPRKAPGRATQISRAEPSRKGRAQKKQR